MKNILGTTENLELFDNEGRKVYNFYKYSKEYSYECTYDLNGKILTYKDSEEFSYEYTYDLNGKELTFKNSDEQMRGFNIPEYTMEELVEKLGNFKIKK